MSDRLDELRRQRALVQQQLEWLDAEIAAETARRVAVGAPANEAVGRPRPASPIESISLSTAPPTEDGDALIKHYTANLESAEAQTKRGCWTVFLLSFVLLAAVVGAWYLLRVR